MVKRRCYNHYLCYQNGNTDDRNEKNVRETRSSIAEVMKLLTPDRDTDHYGDIELVLDNLVGVLDIK